MSGIAISALKGRNTRSKTSVRNTSRNGSAFRGRCGGACLWERKFSSVKKGRFSEDLSAFWGRTLGILGAHNPICTCRLPVVDCPLFVERWEFYVEHRAAYGRGKR